jgi:ribosomal protein S18 acetylase RimI-like enzyme
MFQKLTNVPKNKLADLLIKAGIVYPFPFKGYIIAAQESEIVGIMMLRWLNQERSKAKRDLSAASKYGFINVFRLILGLQFLDSKPKNGVCYIEYLAVKPTVRCKGIGTRLINYGRRFAIQNGFNEFSLDVVSSNLAAQRLYKRMGFEIVKRERSITSKLLTGIEEWFYMSQILKQT